MLRKFHSYPGLIAALFVLLLSVTGTVLALQAVAERAVSTVPPDNQMNVAQLADSISAQYTSIDRLERAPSGSIRVYYNKDGQIHADLVNPQTGQTIAAYEPSTAIAFIKNLHRSLLMGAAGKMITGIASALMVLLTISGILMLVARLGGWKALFSPIRGSLGQRLHAELGRFAVLGLFLSALTGVYMSIVTFGLVTDGMNAEPDFPASVSQSGHMPLENIAALRQVDINDLRELKFPAPGDPTDVFTLTTGQGMGYIDPGTGQMLSWLPHGFARQVYETVYMLHTGQGLWMIAVILALSGATVPVLSLTGTLIWWRRRSSERPIRHNAKPQAADTVILVGSEGNATWGFAAALHGALTKAGHKVHTAPMNNVAPSYDNAERMFIMTSTYGNGAAPSSATRFLDRLQAGVQPVPVAVLGFGDRSFPSFCKYAEDVAMALKSQGWPTLVDVRLIDRQSSHDFSLWGADVGKAMGAPLLLEHTAERIKTVSVQLIDRVDYGADMQAPTSIFRFGVPKADNSASLWRKLFPRKLPRFAAGDLVGIVPAGSPVPRFYSLASSTSDGELEICVRKQPGGMCSGQLHSLQPGDRIEVFIRENRHFRPSRSNAPLILIGAGAGIGPLAGFARHNTSGRPLYFYWGGRNPASDYLYEGELARYAADKRISSLNIVFSRIANGGYVQDKLLANAAEIRELIAQGAQVMVCGGREMAQGVMAAIDTIVAPLGHTPQTLRAERRYHEDVY